MSKNELIRSLKVEIKKINRLIDYKIMQGLPYYAESRKHKFLTMQLKRLTPTQGFFSRSMSFVGTFMF